MNALWTELVELARENVGLALLVAFVIAGAESIVGLSILVPSTAIFVALAPVLDAAGLNLLFLWLVVSAGASAGDWAGYGMGYRFEHRVRAVWPLSRHPGMLEAGKAFFARWGVLSLFIGRFLGPGRSLIMLTAGMCRMPPPVFFIASFLSAAVWAAAVLAPVVAGARWLLS
jgi:membrane protein DedA with SNARE-associated domain